LVAERITGPGTWVTLARDGPGALPGVPGIPRVRWVQVCLRKPLGLWPWLKRIGRARRARHSPGCGCLTGHAGDLAIHAHDPLDVGHGIGNARRGCSRGASCAPGGHRLAPELGLHGPAQLGQIEGILRHKAVCLGKRHLGVL